MSGYNVVRHICRKAAGNTRSPLRIAATSVCDNGCLTGKRKREREKVADDESNNKL